jgi:alkylation response protein AidB-like acyl-CoA dehydrogenase
MRRDLYEPDHGAFREVVQAYVKREVTPNQQRWEQEHIVDQQAWRAAGKQSIIGLLIPERAFARPGALAVWVGGRHPGPDRTWQIDSGNRCP